jgi:hypothetical protein
MQLSVLPPQLLKLVYTQGLRCDADGRLITDKLIVSIDLGDIYLA